MAFGQRKYAIRLQVREASAKKPRRLTLANQKRIGSGVTTPGKRAKNAQFKLKSLLRGSKIKSSGAKAAVNGREEG